MKKTKQKKFKGTKWQDHVIARGSDDPRLKQAQIGINAAEARLMERLDRTPGKVFMAEPGACKTPDAIFLELNPWDHRSKGMSCATCMWCVMKVGATGEKSKLGRCRRHAPTMSGYPVVYETDFCGDHKLDENKVG